MKHTPGPWIAEDVPSAGWEIKGMVAGFKDPITFFELPNERHITFSLNEKGEIWGNIAYEHWVQFPSETWEKMQEANAQLMGATPDLLAACQYVVDWHREHDSGDGELYGLDFVTTCINAIAKAT